jgi:hypothetical protein
MTGSVLPDSSGESAQTSVVLAVNLKRRQLLETVGGNLLFM